MNPYPVLIIAPFLVCGLMLAIIGYLRWRKRRARRKAKPGPIELSFLNCRCVNVPVLGDSLAEHKNRMMGDLLRASVPKKPVCYRDDAGRICSCPGCIRLEREAREAADREIACGRSIDLRPKACAPDSMEPYPTPAPPPKKHG
jgi:hypothetical protein